MALESELAILIFLATFGLEASHLIFFCSLSSSGKWRHQLYFPQYSVENKM